MSDNSSTTSSLQSELPRILDSDRDEHLYVITKESQLSLKDNQGLVQSWHNPSSPVKDRVLHKPVPARRRFSNTLPTPNQVFLKDSQRPQRDHEEVCMRDMLDMMLTRTQDREFDGLEEQKRLQKKFESVENILKSLLHYIECVSLEVKSSARLTKELSKLAVDEELLAENDSIQKIIDDLITHTNVDLCAVKTKIYEILEEPKELSHLLSDYHEKKADFNKAVQNFKIILDTQQLSVMQMQRLRKQFEVIQLNFKHCRCMLDQKLPQLISQRIEGMFGSLRNLQDKLQVVANDKRHLMELVKLLEASLCPQMSLKTLEQDGHIVQSDC